MSEIDSQNPENGQRQFYAPASGAMRTVRDILTIWRMSPVECLPIAVCSTAKYNPDKEPTRRSPGR